MDLTRKKSALLLAFLFCACQHDLPKTKAPSASTAAVSERITSAKGNVTSAEASAKQAQGNVAQARTHAESIGKHLDTVDYKGHRALELLNRPTTNP